MPRVESLIRACEVWVPDGSTMRHHSGAYAGNTEFARVSSRKAFRKGEGLPGRVWQRGRAELWEELGPLFVRRELAQAAGMTAALGLPIFCGVELRAVVVLLCAEGHGAEAAIELWDVDHEQRCLVHAAGYYAGLEQFARVSRLLQFQPGSGVPGLAWQRAAPVVVEDLRAARSFTRAALLGDSLLSSALAVPIGRRERIEQVVLLLSAATTPVARALQIWIPSERGLFLEQAAYATGSGRFAAAGLEPRFGSGEGLPGAVWETGMPQVLDRFESSQAFDEAYFEAGFELAIGIPFYEDGAVSAVVALAS